MLLHGDRVISAALDRGIVGDDDTLAAAHPTDSRDDPCASDIAAVKAMRSQLRQLQKRAARVEQYSNAFPRRELACVLVLLQRGGRASPGCPSDLLTQRGRQRP